MNADTKNMKVTVFHMAPASAHDRIASMGLTMRAEDGSSAAEDYRNEAGAAVYMWKCWPTAQIECHSRTRDVWAVTIDEELLSVDPSNLGPFGAVYVARDLTHADCKIEYLGPAPQAILNLRPDHLSLADVELAYHLHHDEAYAESVANSNDDLTFAWLSRWDEDDEAYRPWIPVAVASDITFGEQEGEDHLDRIVHTPYGTLTIRDTVRCYECHTSTVYDWEWIIAPSRELVCGI